jgi:hypothetical protein
MVEAKRGRFMRLWITGLVISFSCIISLCAQDASSIQKDALRIAWDHFAASHLQSGDSWFIYFEIPPDSSARWNRGTPKTTQTGYIQLKEVSPKVFPGPTASYADRLNGVQWNGTVIFGARVLRVYYTQESRWGPWQDVGEPGLFGTQPFGGFFQCKLTLKNGQWSSSDLEYFATMPAIPYSRKLSKPDANEIPP